MPFEPIAIFWSKIKFYCRYSSFAKMLFLTLIVITIIAIRFKLTEFENYF